MKKVLYEPVLRDDHHLVNSRCNPERVRGQSRDKNNKNPDIVEWKKVEVDEEIGVDNNAPLFDDVEQRQISPWLEQGAELLGEFIGNLIVNISSRIIKSIITHWRENAWPWIRDRFKELFSSSMEKSNTTTQKNEDIQKMAKIVYAANCPQNHVNIDELFEQTYINMEEEEVRQHLLNILYHMLSLANEIRIISQAQIRRKCENEKDYRDRIKASEIFITNKLSENINRLLSNDKLAIDADNVNMVYNLLGGGVRKEGEYIPVNNKSVYKAIIEQGKNGKRTQA